MLGFTSRITAARRAQELSVVKDFEVAAEALVEVRSENFRSAFRFGATYGAGFFSLYWDARNSRCRCSCSVFPARR